MKSVCAVVCVLALLVAVDSQFWGRGDDNPWWGNGGDPDFQDFPPFRPRPPFPQRPTRPPRPQTTTTTTTTQPPPTQAPGAGATAPVDSFGRVANCDCPAPPQYNPVCGSDGVTYNNPQILECANLCGHPVTVSFVGLCVAG